MRDAVLRTRRCWRGFSNPRTLAHLNHRGRLSRAGVARAGATGVTALAVVLHWTGLLGFSRVAFLSFETPQSQLRFEYPDALDFTCKRVGVDWVPAQLQKNIAPDTLAYSVYVHDYMSDFNIAAASVDFKWLEDEPPENYQ